jgi:LysM domain
MQTSANSIKRRLTLLRGLAVLVSAVLLVPWLWNVTADAGHAAVRGVPLRPDESLTAIVASAAVAGVAWLAVGVLLELLSLVPGAVGRGADRVADVVTPRLVRRAAGALLGVGLVAGLAPGASVAAPSTAATASTAARATSDPLPDPGLAPLPDPGFAPLPNPGLAPPTDPGLAPLPDPGLAPVPVPDPGRAPAAEVPTARGPGWVPGPPVVRAHPDVRVLSPVPRPDTTRDTPAEVVVRRGDSLWSIAARQLGPDASDAEIARVWPAWFEANRDVVGDDPDLLRPGQVLRAPAGVDS